MPRHCNKIDGRSVERLVLLSDAVLAIVVTRRGLDLRTPAAKGGGAAGASLKRRVIEAQALCAIGATRCVLHIRVGIASIFLIQCTTPRPPRWLHAGGS